MKRTLEDAWREISPLLDDALELECNARQCWLEALQARSPAQAAAVCYWLTALDRLRRENFLGLDLTAPEVSWSWRSGRP